MVEKLSVTTLSKLIVEKQSNFSENGTEIHRKIEAYLRTKDPLIFDTNVNIMNQLNDFCNDRRELELFGVECYLEKIIKVDNKKYKLNGKIDAIFKNKETNNYVIIDWKYSQSYLKNHVYEESLRLYKLLFENKTKFKVEEICLIYLSDKFSSYVPIQINYNSNDTLKEKIKMII